MSGFIAILKHTIKSLFRSPAYFVSGAVCIICAITIPLMIIDRPNVVEHYELAISYSLIVISTILFLCCICNSCTMTARDIESYRIHMILTKPIGRASYFLGRFAGSSICFLFLLFASLCVLYGVIASSSSLKSLPSADVEKVDQTIFVSKRKYLPVIKNLKEQIDLDVADKLTLYAKEKRELSNTEIDEIKTKAYYSLLTHNGEVKPDSSKEFEFEISSTIKDSTIYLTFKPYVGSINVMEKQIRDKVFAKMFIKTNDSDFSEIKILPDKLISNDSYTIPLKGLNFSNSQNTLILKIQNFDKTQSIFFRLNQSPEILIDYGSFPGNLLRTTILMACGIVLMSAIGCALGGFLSLPIAIFAIVFYMFFGSLCSYILSDSDMYQYSKELDMKIGYSLSKVIIRFVSPIQSFQSFDEISSGKILEFDSIYTTLKKYFALQLIIFIVGGIYLFSRREFGAVIKK